MKLRFFKRMFAKKLNQNKGLKMEVSGCIYAAT